MTDQRPEELLSTRLRALHEALTAIDARAEPTYVRADLVRRLRDQAASALDAGGSDVLRYSRDPHGRSSSSESVFSTTE